MAKRDIIAIGGSAGSGAVLKQILGKLPPNLPASVFVTTHVPSTQPSYLAEVLAGVAAAPVGVGAEGEPIERGRIYLAPQDRHMLIGRGVIHLGFGPRENLARPAIDPMFRSAALSYGSRAVGVVLTGMLNDGASGLAAIKEVGGTAVVQDPADAYAEEMPRAALDAVEADHVTRGEDLASLLIRLARTDAGPAFEPSDDLVFEVEVAAGERVGSENLRQFADPATLTCPDCQGVLSQVRDSRPLRFRCQIGHAFTADVLAAHDERLNDAIKIAMRVMEERVDLVSRMAREARGSGRLAVADLYERRAEEYQRYATTLREAAQMSRKTRRVEWDRP